MAAGAIAVIVQQARQAILRHFIGQGATSADHAVAYDPDADGRRHARVRRRLFRRLRDYGAIREARPGLFWLDEDKAEAFRWDERKRVLGVLALAAGVIAAIGLLA